MSIILNALKKSEAQRRLGKAPTLADTAAITNVEEKPERKIWPWLVLLLVIMLTTGWYVRDWIPLDRIIGGQNEFTTTMEPVAQQIPAAGETSNLDDTNNNRLDVIAREARAVPDKPIPGSPGARTTSRSSSDFTTPVESYTAPSSTNSDSNSAVAVVGARAGTGAGVEADTGGKLPTPGARAANVWPEPAQAGAQVGREPLTIYEIPREIRSGLPEFKITLQVYAEEPENRFALVNGLRMVEGNELAAGLVLTEIRQRGLVFSYRDYRFIVGN